MFKNISQRFAEAVISHDICKAEDRDLLIIGCQSAISLILNIIGVIVIAWILGVFCEGLIYLISFYLLRICASGFHMKDAISCFWFSFAVELICILGIRFFIPNSLQALLGVAVITFLTCLVLCPVPNIKIKREKRAIIQCRKLCVTMCAIELAACVIFVVLRWRTIAYSMAYGWLLFIVLVFMGHMQNRFYSYKTT
ncbi:hypothetical protein GNQ08_27795 [Paenibacillus macerans]|uniref:Accessory regulator AgrB n=1 Tax=Paenibacillus macerans TaxID=44252 RepID=A0A6N8F2L1_PAEMA|nr:accessory gene regulator B family protein [Paenibacillus macerans]MEC0334165.1 accessory gene regulator B family protein [Paenibacillus macerans]MED4955889.1 accessory gene regulator B family protein [Paenibacillus macerans]MUG26169.1 hypothetical protein [Paenibacillus macerans]UMV47117.1 accessory gene regulator B family protein [Paenibacillus macerans]